MPEIRDRNNYPDIVIAPYQDPRTKAIYPAAVYTSGLFSVSSREKVLLYEVDVYASIEAFEAGGDRISTPIVRRIYTPARTFINQNGVEVTLDYDTSILANGQVVFDVLQVLNGFEAQFNALPPEPEPEPSE